MLKRNEKIETINFYEVDGPALISIKGAIYIHVDSDGSVDILGLNNVDIRTEKTLTLEGESVIVRSLKEDVRIETKKNLRINTEENVLLNCSEDFKGDGKEHA